MRRLKSSDKQWIVWAIELPKFFKTATIIYGVSDYKEDVKILLIRIQRLYKRSGRNFTFLYLKEVGRLIIRFLAGSSEPRFHLKGIYVSRDQLGLPNLLTANLKATLISRDEKMVKFIMALIQVYRVMESVQRIKLSTILAPFSGISRMLDESRIAGILGQIAKRRLAFTNIKLIKLETASPTGHKALWNSTSDIIALLYHPSKLWALLMLYPFNTPVNVLIFIWFVILLILGCFYIMFYCALCRLPLISVFYKYTDDIPLGKKHVNYWRCFRSKWYIGIYYMEPISKESMALGRLSVVYDQAGKARVVAITNYWIQVCLYPIHNFLFSILKEIEQDGTFDQMKPLKVLISKESNDKFHSFDLSAATDRIPIDVQIQVLNSLRKNLGTYWSHVLDLEWLSPNKKQWLKYSVGQPMGAYSSWGMLALTHHVIVRYSAQLCGIESFSDYAILGDDIVIRNDVVAESYLKVMSTLGVEINLSKSVQSKDFAEFAKVWRGPHLNFTPIGAGVILQFIRNKDYLGVILSEMFKTQVFKNYGACLKFLQALPPTWLKAGALGLWSVFGLKGTMWNVTQGDVSYLKRSIAMILHSARSETIMTKYLVWNALRISNMKLNHESLHNIFHGIQHLFFNSLRYTSKYRSLGYFEILVRFISPGFWIYLVLVVKDLIKYYEQAQKLLQAECSWPSIIDLSLDEFAVVNINWSDRKALKRAGRYYRMVMSNLKLVSQIDEPLDTLEVPVNIQGDIDLGLWEGPNLRRSVKLPTSLIWHWNTSFALWSLSAGFTHTLSSKVKRKTRRKHVPYSKNKCTLRKPLKSKSKSKVRL
nr:MAG: putative RNA dependent RNA polymerase [Guangxi mito-like virus 16]